MRNFFRDVWPVVVIVATIAGAAWTAAWNIRGFLTTELATQIAASESRMAARIEATETRLTTQIAASEMRLTAQIAENQAQIAELRRLFVDHLEDHANAR